MPKPQQKHAVDAADTVYDTPALPKRAEPGGASDAVTQSLLRLLAEHTSTLLWSTDRELRATLMAGGPGADLAFPVTNIPLVSLFEGQPGASEAVAAHNRALHGEPATYEARYQGRTYACRVGCLTDGEGQVVGCVGVGVDVTEEKCAREREALHRAVRDALRSAETQAEGIHRILPILAEGTAWDLAEVWLVAPEGNSLRRAGSWHGGGPAAAAFAAGRARLTFAAGQDLPGRAWASGRPAWALSPRVNAASRDAGTSPEPGMQAALAIPIRDRPGNSLGVVAFYRHAPRPPSKDIEEVLAAAAGQLEQFLQRTGAEDLARLREQALAVLPIGVVLTDCSKPDEPVFAANQAFERLTGYASQEVVGLNLRLLQGPATDRATVTRIKECLRSGQSFAGELINYRKDGQPWWNALSVVPLRDRSGAITHHVGIQVDVSARRTLEDQLRQLQRTEAVSRLTVGVAHDFNNILCVILGYAELLMGLTSDPRVGQGLDEIRKAASQAGNLTRQLLAFSARQARQERVVDLNTIIADMANMLRRLIGENIQLVTVLGSAPGGIYVDPVQLQQVVLNLVANARDAMPDGGRLTVTTGKASRAAGPGNAGTDLVCLTISDTGHGMREEVRANLFEPFFTTKGPDGGTGLGLATVQGIVAQDGGHIDVESRPGQGTEVHIYWPRVDAPVEIAQEDRAAGPWHGKESLLVVEDADDVRAALCAILQQYGYTVLAASTGPQALRIAASHQGPLHLLVTDTVLAEMSGRDLAQQLHAVRPGLKALFLSGYPLANVLERGALDEGVPFLAKPFTREELGRAVRKLLDNLEA